MSKEKKDRHPKLESYTKTPNQIKRGSSRYPQATHQES